MFEIIRDILNMSAWRMDAPELFGTFHIASSIITAAAAAAAAVFAARRIRNTKAKQSGAGPERAGAGADSLIIRILSRAGWLLAALEVYKQLFLYFIVNEGVYDWWYFPFQLCSVPMYLCILLPLMKGRLRAACLNFMGGYTFVSAAAALIFPEDILRSYVSLTLHGFIWHGILLFISLVILISGPEAGLSAATRKAAPDAACLFAGLCVIAVTINVAAEPAMQAASAARLIPHSYAAMFYMNPFHISPQPVVSGVQKTAGIPAGLMLYALAIATAGSAVTLISHGISSLRDRR